MKTGAAIGASRRLLGTSCSAVDRGAPSVQRYNSWHLLPFDNVNRYCYGVYGIRVVSDTALVLPAYVDAPCLGDVACVIGGADVFAAALDGAAFRSPPESWYRYARLQDGATYVRWQGVGEFIVGRDGRRICCRPEEGASAESFRYLLGQALVRARQARAEPLHATAVVVSTGRGLKGQRVRQVDAGRMFRRLSPCSTSSCREIPPTACWRIPVRRESNCSRSLPAG
jgi:hypothetical protein